jgi:hypothetical protein
MSDGMNRPSLTRRAAIAGMGVGGMTLASQASRLMAQETTAHSGPDPHPYDVPCYLSVADLKSDASRKVGECVATAGFYRPGDGGGAFYEICRASDLAPNDANIVALPEGLVANLLEQQAVNYRMFGAMGDGEQDDGVAIKLAHQYANQHKIPVVNLSGEFWITRTNSIPIRTNVDWGSTVFHIDERFNDRRYPRFVVENDSPAKKISLDEEMKAALLRQVKPGVQIIPELAPYAGHLVSVVDANDRIGIRSGESYSKRGWAREELFYVEEEGRVIGDIAWEFQDFTSVEAVPCSDTYLVIEGGGFHYSGDTPEGGKPGYYQHGIAIQRSRTIIREQWMGLEQGRRDTSLEPRSGFYVFRNVYDVTLENIRAMPWEKNRKDKSKAVKHGTYGIGGARMLNCTFRNLTAEAGWVAWGVFGTNLNKNFRVENCRLNRIDVHFHCWNLTISNCTIGFKGITLTGGGQLVIENTTRHGNSFVSFRRDYGAKWDGHIQLRNCRLMPASNYGVTVLSFRPADFEYKYPIGIARGIRVDNLIIDYQSVPESRSACWLMDIAPFSQTSGQSRLFFPEQIEFRNVTVEGRDQGVRVLKAAEPFHYELRRDGGYDGNQLVPNCSVVVKNVQLEQLRPQGPDDLTQLHLQIGSAAAGDYLDSRSLYPSIRFIDCQHLVVYLGNCIASLFCERCGVNIVNAPQLKGEIALNGCRLQPDVKQAEQTLYQLASSLGTRFTNCTVHAPRVAGKVAVEQLDQVGFLQLNKSVKHFHLNTALGNEVLAYLQRRGEELQPEFVSQLRSHYSLPGHE